jgi:hypothetical protein
MSTHTTARTGLLCAILCGGLAVACASKAANVQSPDTRAGAGAAPGSLAGSNSVAGDAAGQVASAGSSAQAGLPAASGGGAGQAAPALTAGSGGRAGHTGSAGAAALGGSGVAAHTGSAGPAAVGGSGGTAGVAATAGGAAPGPALPSVTSVDGDGPFKTKQDLASGPKGASGLFQPTELGQNGLKHPIFLFGCGGMSNPAAYATELSRIASHGFVVLADIAAIGDNATVFKASLDWIIAENARAASPLFGKLDTTKIAAGGHSIGSVNAFLFGPDPRLTTTIHVAGGSLDNVNNPSAPTTGMGGKGLIHPTAYICDKNDTFANDTKAQVDYTATTAPVFFTLMSGTDHIGVFKAALPAIVGWLRWQLAGEVERRSMFLDPSGEFCVGQYMSVSKNW